MVSAVLVAVGVAQLRRGNREEAYRNLDRALLIAVFVTQVFSFVESQFCAVFGLAVALVLLAALRAVSAQRAREVRLGTRVARPNGGRFASAV
jgi:hypothetical protein